MIDAGFYLLVTEWWHFGDRDFHDPATQLPVVYARDIGIKLPVWK
jgi:hypothetical protein